jgi:hypothetical protein
MKLLLHRTRRRNGENHKNYSHDGGVSFNWIFAPLSKHTLAVIYMLSRIRVVRSGEEKV